MNTISNLSAYIPGGSPLPGDKEEEEQLRETGATPALSFPAPRQVPDHRDLAKALCATRRDFRRLLAKLEKVACDNNVLRQAQGRLEKELKQARDEGVEREATMTLLCAQLQEEKDKSYLRREAMYKLKKKLRYPSLLLYTPGGPPHPHLQGENGRGGQTPSHS